MRLALLAGVFFAATASFAQSNACAPSTAVPHSWTLPAFTPPVRRFTELPQGWRFNRPQVEPKLTLPNFASLSDRAGKEIDPKILVQPPQSALGNQPPGTLVAQNLYPGLEFKRITDSQSGTLPIPTVWPNLRAENIPIVWQKLNIHPSDTLSRESPAKK